jgi:hypothetical protein
LFVLIGRSRSVSYPFLDIVGRFPRDYYWMFPALLATPLYVAFMLGLQARARPERRLGLVRTVLSTSSASPRTTSSTTPL